MEQSINELSKVTLLVKILWQTQSILCKKKLIPISAMWELEFCVFCHGGTSDALKLALLHVC